MPHTTECGDETRAKGGPYNLRWGHCAFTVEFPMNAGHVLGDIDIVRKQQKGAPHARTRTVEGCSDYDRR